jgi:hypothetical protein
LHAFCLPIKPIDNILYIPSGHYAGCPNDWIPDQVGAGTLLTMQKYSLVYPHLFETYNQRVYFNLDMDGYDLHIPEKTLYRHMQNHGVHWEFCKCQYEIDGARFCNDELQVGSTCVYKPNGMVTYKPCYFETQAFFNLDVDGYDLHIPDVCGIYILGWRC